MSRTPITIRDAEPNDSVAVLRVWTDLQRRSAPERSGRPRIAEARASIARIAADPSQRLVLATLDDEVIGAALLSRSMLNPLQEGDAVQVSHLQVLPHARRHGAGKALVEAAVAWAEEKGASTVMTAATAGDRDANRYLARLGFGSLALIRVASVGALRAGMMPPEPPACARTDVRTTRTVGQVLAQRRQQRRARANVS